MPRVRSRPGHTVLSSLGVGGSKKAGTATKKHLQQQPAVEIGTVNKNGVDFNWLPDHIKADLRSEYQFRNDNFITTVIYTEFLYSSIENEAIVVWRMYIFRGVGEIYH